MPTYPHYQETKKDKGWGKDERIGACLTCRFWEAPGPRREAEVPLVALCIQPELVPFQLVVSGGSACNRWEKLPNVSEEAHRYASRGEEK
jgi:hypothetical protein